ncbi:MAG: STAS domain-containing protein [Pseudanabaenaceae cyanobacterium SKYGB_i_bin29]|nr:STAS domain-containing protein [Pseudanabaenaceae cyanobacterium SKYG29]MDW8421991.1 STAS domain-containing protein [Pseudanabaenaceae cyanobacterium SKYGB_i_bin29]
MNADIKIIAPSGRLDITNVAKFRLDISGAVALKPKAILIDLKDVTFMDSSGLGALVSALKTARSSQCDLYICSLSEQVQMLFNLTSMSKIFKIYPDRESCLQDLGVSQAK